MKLTPTNLKYLSYISFAVVIAFTINYFQGAVSPLFLSMVLGLIVANTIGWDAEGREAATFAAKRCLRLGVVFLGFQISFDKFTEIGFAGLGAVILIVAVVFLSIRYLAQRSGLSPSLALFIGGGFAICGATAIAALSSTRKSEERDVSYAVALVALCGTLSVFLIPPFASLLQLSDATAGAWIGAAVHDVGQVIATAALLGPEALDSAVIVKLTRVVMLVPLILFLTTQNNSARSATRAAPIFVLGFLLTAILVNLFSIPVPVITAGKEISKVLLSYGLFAMGLGVRWLEIRRLGARPLAFGLAAWIASAAFTLVVIRLAGL
jgi:uncharacterized integral membrane protein (TIGR00698 family)